METPGQSSCNIKKGSLTYQLPVKFCCLKSHSTYYISGPGVYDQVQLGVGSGQAQSKVNCVVFKNKWASSSSGVSNAAAEYSGQVIDTHQWKPTAATSTSLLVGAALGSLSSGIAASASYDGEAWSSSGSFSSMADSTQSSLSEGGETAVSDAYPSFASRDESSINEHISEVENNDTLPPYTQADDEYSLSPPPSYSIGRIMHDVPPPVADTLIMPPPTYYEATYEATVMRPSRYSRACLRQEGDSISNRSQGFWSPLKITAAGIEGVFLLGTIIDMAMHKPFLS